MSVARHSKLTSTHRCSTTGFGRFGCRWWLQQLGEQQHRKQLFSTLPMLGLVDAVVAGACWLIIDEAERRFHDLCSCGWPCSRRVIVASCSGSRARLPEGRPHAKAPWVCRIPFASKHSVGLSSPDRYPLVERGLESLWSFVRVLTRSPSRTVRAEVAQRPLEGGRQRRSESVKEMKELESGLLQMAMPSRCRVRGGTAGAEPQSV